MTERTKGIHKQRGYLQENVNPAVEQRHLGSNWRMGQHGLFLVQHKCLPLQKVRKKLENKKDFMDLGLEVPDVRKEATDFLEPSRGAQRQAGPKGNSLELLCAIQNH